MFNRFIGLGLLLSLIVLASPVYGQSPTGARLFPPDTQAFPRIQAYLDITDASGGFVHGLGSEDVRILENGIPVSLVDFNELRPGAQAVIAINPSDGFTIRNSQGMSRYDYIYDSLEQWAAARRGSSVDDLSVLVTGGPSRTHTTNPGELLVALASYSPETVPLVPSLDTLVQALDVATDTPPRAGMEKAILYITSPLSDGASLALEDIILRAQQQGVRIYVWLVGSEDVSETPDAELLTKLAESTGGQFYFYSAEGAFPSPDETLNKLRDIYQLAYESSIGSGSSRQLEAEVRVGSEQVKAPAISFDLNLLPPDPAFIMPVAVITRSLATQGDLRMQPVGLKELEPREQSLPILVDFPDGKTRPLQWTRLYVDGALVDEKLSPPFDQFVWDISETTANGQHVLQIAAMDSLGLEGKSIEVPVEIRVVPPQTYPLYYLMQRGPAIVGLVALLGSAVFLLAMIVSGKVNPYALYKPVGSKIARRREAKPEISTSADLGSENRIGSGNRRISSWVNRLHWPQRRLSPQTHAFLVYISEDEETAPNMPISISSDEITFGRDKNQAVLLVDDPSVEMLHSRMIRERGDVYRLIDENSIAGTWVNYAPVGRDGVELEHGDLIHIGRVGFRFRLRELKKVRKPVIQREDTGA
jgi:hypothetical protein